RARRCCRRRRWPSGARRAAPSPSRTPGWRRWKVPEVRLLFRHVDEPGLATMEVYRRLGGYRALERAFRELEPDELLRDLEASGLRGRGGAGCSVGKKGCFLPHGEMEKCLW